MYDYMANLNKILGLTLKAKLHVSTGVSSKATNSHLSRRRHDMMENDIWNVFYML